MIGNMLSELRLSALAHLLSQKLSDNHSIRDLEMDLKIPMLHCAIRGHLGELLILASYVPDSTQNYLDKGLGLNQNTDMSSGSNNQEGC